MRFVKKQYKTFDDYIILPQYSEVRSRSECNLSQEIGAAFFPTPILSSNMVTVTGPALSDALILNSGTPVLHRFQSPEEMANEVKRINNPRLMVSLGLGEAELARAELLSEVGAKIFVIDVAHGASIGVARQYNRLRQVLPKGSMIAVGNFATRESASDFLDAVASHPDFLKVGIGNGAACETRQVAGVGVPQLDAIHEIHDLGIPIIADGGIRNPSDLSKSLAAGASLVMIGSLFAGCEESPGQIVRVNDKLYKEYRGSAAFKSYQEQGKVASHRAAEGAEGLVQYQGTVAELMQHLTAGLRSSMSYTGAFNLAQFREKAILAEVSGHTLTESKTRLL